MRQTWWLSFCDARRPTGDQFLGAVVIDIDERDVARSEGVTTALRARHGLPPLPNDSDAQWLAAAMWKTHRLECNPGGEVAASRFDDRPMWAVVGPYYPRGVLLSRAAIDAIDDAIDATIADPRERV